MFAGGVIENIKEKGANNGRVEFREETRGDKGEKGPDEGGGIWPGSAKQGLKM